MAKKLYDEIKGNSSTHRFNEIFEYDRFEPKDKILLYGEDITNMKTSDIYKHIKQYHMSNIGKFDNLSPQESAILREAKLRQRQKLK